jgi:cytochrome c oxidase subunit IV
MANLESHAVHSNVGANDGHGDDHGHGHGISHTASLQVLLGTGGALLALTVITVLATKVDFGPSINLAFAMAIAVVKATLVVLFFMHLKYDKVFHSVLLIGGILAAALFVGFALMDSGQYQQSIDWDQNNPPASPIGPKPIVGR